MSSSAIDIAVGLSIRSKVWKNKKVKWQAIKNKLKDAAITKVTLKQYLKANKDERLKIKDVGGYVGGYLRSGKRKPENITHRQLLTLDVDYAHLDFWQNVTLIYDNAAVLHATYSFTNDSPRYRLVMPLKREVTPDEYVALSRKVAGFLDIELFDNTTFQPYRLMFWPAVPQDVEYYYREQDGPWIDPDEILKGYKDWRDSTQWPTSKKNIQSIRDASKKQENPDDKKGLIGYFCRAFTISSAIDTFLSKEYTATFNSRYTYKKGSTASGLITYDDKFAYSHHGTDPISGKLCNAFDLVRIHLFGDLDTGAEKNKTTLPSFKKMQDFAARHDKVKALIAQENIAEAEYDFEDYKEDKPSESLPKEDLKWAEQLEVDGKGNYLNTSKNLNLIFINDSRLKKVFRLNLFDGKWYAWRDLPWRKIPSPEPMKNVDFSGVRNYIEVVYKIVSRQKIEDSLILSLQKNSFHPIRDYLNKREWDKTKRIETLLIDYFGVEDSAYTRAAIKKSLVAAVARVFEPGVKYDMVLVLCGYEATGKSTFISKLGMGWFSDTFMTVNGKEAYEQLQGAWLIEMAELAGLKKAEVETIKHFISKQEDMFRPAYGRTNETFKRQCVFFGTTNESNPLKGSSGNRRFNCVDVRFEKATKNVFEIKQETVNQIWAEAVDLYKAGEKLYLEGEAAEIAKVEQVSHAYQDERQGIIEKYLNTLLPKNWAKKDLLERRLYIHDEIKVLGSIVRTKVCVAEIWCECLQKEKSTMDRYKTREINEILKSLKNWEYVKSTANFGMYGKQKYYKKINDLL